MNRFLVALLVIFVALIAVPVAHGQKDVAGSKDYPGISRMPGYYIADYRDTEFDLYKFTILEGGKEKEEAVEGHRYELRYNLMDNAKMPSELQVIRNYQNAARAIGGKVLHDRSTEFTTIRLSREGKEVWVKVSVGNMPSGVPIFINIIEKQTMQQEVTMDAKLMAQDIEASGRVAIYGILFDTGKAELKPDATPALAEIAKLLKNNPNLKVYVVGHTDMVANLATNLKLSQARAQAVVDALVTQYGIAGTRLIPHGDGPYAPVASNKTEEGRAKNRRVELVEIATN